VGSVWGPRAEANKQKKGPLKGGSGRVRKGTLNPPEKRVNRLATCWGKVGKQGEIWGKGKGTLVKRKLTDNTHYEKAKWLKGHGKIIEWGAKCSRPFFPGGKRFKGKDESTKVGGPTSRKRQKPWESAREARKTKNIGSRVKRHARVQMMQRHQEGNC